MKNTFLKKKSTIGGQNKLRQNTKATAKPKKQRAEQKSISTQTQKGPDLHYHYLFENMLNGVAYCKMIFEGSHPQDFINLEVNNAFESLTGLKDVVGKKASEVIPGIRESNPELFEIYGRVSLSGKPERFETYLKDLKKWFSISVFSPRKEYFVAIFDVSNEHDLASDYFSKMVDATPDSIVVINQAGKIILVNLRTEKIFGYSRHEILGKSIDFLVPKRYQSKHSVHRQKYFEKPLVRQMGAGLELIGLAKDGTEFPVDISLSPFQTEESLLVMAAIRDISERKQAEAALAKSEQDYRMLFENMPIALYRTADDGRILDANKAMVKMFGYPGRESLLADNIVELYLDPASDLKFKNEIEKTGVVSNFEAEFKRPDGTTFWTEDHNRIIRDKDGKPLFYEGTLIDITKRKLAQEQIGRQLDHLAALREIDRMIASSFDIHYNLTWILGSVTKELGVDAADVLTLNPVSNQLDFGGRVGFRTKAANISLMRPGQSYAMRAILDRQVIHIPNLKDEPNDLLSKKIVADEDFVSYYGVPLLAKGKAKGVLEVFHRSRLEPDQNWIDFLNTLAGQAALAIDNASLFDNLQRSNMDLTLAYDATIEGWSRAMDLRDKETEGHTRRVTEMTMALAGLFGLKDEDLVGIRRGAMLHDIGKMGVPDGILLKAGPLTDEEWILMRKHPALAFEMLSPIHYLQSAMDIPYCHHEKWDGTGYPRGLKGEEIPLAARIFSIVDVWDALTSDRPYRKAWSNEKTLEYLRSESGTSFDPAVMKICLDAGVFDRIGRN